MTFHWFITYNLKFRRKGLIAQYQDTCELLLGRGSKQHTFPSVRVSHGYICSIAPAGWRWRSEAEILQDIHFSIRCCCCCVRTHLIGFWWLLWWTQSETYSHLSHCRSAGKRKATKHKVSTLEMQQTAVANVTRSIFTTIVIIIVHFICGCLSWHPTSK